MRQLWSIWRLHSGCFGFFHLGGVVLLVVAVLAETFGVDHLVSVFAVERRCLSAVEMITQVAHPFGVVFFVGMRTSGYFLGSGLLLWGIGAYLGLLPMATKRRDAVGGLVVRILKHRLSRSSLRENILN